MEPDLKVSECLRSVGIRVLPQNSLKMAAGNWKQGAQIRAYANGSDNDTGEGREKEWIAEVKADTGCRRS